MRALPLLALLGCAGPSGDWDGRVTAGGRTWQAHREAVLATALSPDGFRLATGGADDVLRVWDLRDGRLLYEVASENDYDVTALAYSPDGRHLARGDGDSGLALLDAETGDVVLRFEGHDGTVSSVAFSADGRRLVSQGWDGTTRVWDMSGRCLEIRR